MSKYSHSQIMDAIEAMTADELAGLIETIPRTVGVGAEPIDPNTEQLSVFSSVVQHVPYIFYDGGPTTTIWIDDPGTNKDAFIELMRERIEDFGMRDVLRMKMRALRYGEAYKIEMSVGESYRWIDRLRAIGARFEFEDDYVAETKEVKYTRLPRGMEAKMFQALALHEGGTLSADREYTVYVYAIAEDQFYAPVDNFIFSDAPVNRSGKLYRQAFTCLDREALRKLKRTGRIHFEFSPNAAYHVRVKDDAKAQ